MLYPSSRVLTLVLQYPRRDGPAPAVEEAVLRKCKLLIESGVDHGPRPSMWALQRDHGSCPGTSGDESCSGIAQTDWAFTKTLVPFTRP